MKTETFNEAKRLLNLIADKKESLSIVTTAITSAYHFSNFHISTGRNGIEIDRDVYLSALSQTHARVEREILDLQFAFDNL